MARKSRKAACIEFPKSNQLPQKWKVGIYGRLSNQNAGHEDDQSLVSQVEYVKENLLKKSDLELANVYTDNGYTGTNFERPAFTRLMADLKCGRINCIAVKDLSRFGRNYLETGYYLEKVFPFMNVRFISINDGYDSSKNINDNQNFEMVVKNIVNSFYSKDISLKIASADKMRQKNAMYLGGHRIYGFLKDPKDTHKVVVDPVASLVIRKIFELAIEGKTTTQIADILNKEKVITPAQYLAQIKIISGKHKTRDIKDSSWNQTMIYRTLQNREYKGDYVGRKTKRISPCSKNRLIVK